MGIELIEDARAVWAAWRRLSPVVVNVDDRQRKNMLLHYADASMRNVRLQFLAFALVLFGIAHEAPLTPRILAFFGLSALAMLRLVLIARFATSVKGGRIAPSVPSEALALLMAGLWGCSPLILAPYLPAAHYYALAVVAVAVPSVISASFLSALPAAVALMLIMMVPAIGAFFSYGTQVSVAFGLGTAVLGLALVSRLRTSHRMLLRMFEAEQKNASLISELKAYRLKLERENEELGTSLRNVSEAALRDPLTGAFNRHYLSTIAQPLAERVRERNEAITVGMIDVDHFKRINDRFGHSFGDEVLKAVVTQLTGRLRDGDSLARFGGEEFVVILRGCEVNRARRVAEALRHNVASLQIDTRSGPLMVTASIGLARWSAKEDITQVMQRADRAMYGAKQAGRDRVEIDPIDARDLHYGPEDTTWPARVTQL